MIVVEQQDSSEEGTKRDNRRKVHNMKSRQLSVILVAIMALTALITTVAFIVITTGKRYQSSETIPFITATVAIIFAFASLLKLVNEEPSFLFRAVRSIFLLPSLQRDKLASDVMMRQLQAIRATKLKLEKAKAAEEKALDAEQLIHRSLARLETEISEVRRRGGINLAMGMSITLVGLGILGYAVYTAPSMQAPSAELATYFFPRLSLALITEMFAYFFLRLYKLSMNETKYFQNELTGAEARALSILIASKQETPALLASVAKSLAALDRNHVLEKGQTTVEIEQARIESEALRGVVGSVSQPHLWRRGKRKDQSGTSE